MSEEQKPYIVHVPPNHLERIDAIWMVITTDSDGNEGVAAAQLSEGAPPMPLIAADDARLQSMTQIAEHLAAIVPFRKFKLIKMTTREDVREFGGTRQ